MRKLRISDSNNADFPLLCANCALRIPYLITVIESVDLTRKLLRWLLKIISPACFNSAYSTPEGRGALNFNDLFCRYNTHLVDLMGGTHFWIFGREETIHHYKCVCVGGGGGHGHVIDIV